MKKNWTEFEQSLQLNMQSYFFYLDQLTELALSRFNWINLPNEIDERYLELTLMQNGQALFLQDEVAGYAVMRCAVGGPFTIYDIPTVRRGYADNAVNITRTNLDSVIIYNNMLHKPIFENLRYFAYRLYNFDRIIDINANAQKTPILLKCNENQRLTIKNLYKQYTGNEPVIFADDGLSTEGVQVLSTGAPYVGDKINDLKNKVWNEALTYLGIANVSIQKRERLVTDEVQRNMGGTIASRNAFINSRKQACKEINNMFGLNVGVEFRNTDEIKETNSFEEFGYVEEGVQNE